MPMLNYILVMKWHKPILIAWGERIGLIILIEQKSAYF
ncbi:hypothetical protein F991_01770 [Acinetobacter sp. CIP-A165]|nr:hypothetical protein F991_01770 [Acinetobacter sp. CIP-A165]MDR7016351.1 hypothetical protein [Prolinoborus sp. 3657]